jgi:urocanate hydratase
MGGAQPLAATMAGASMLAIECPAIAHRDAAPARAISTSRRQDLDDALALMEQACASRDPVSVGLVGNAAEILPELVRRGVRPHMVTDQTSAHDLVNGYLPAGWSVAQWQAAQRDPSQHAGLVAAAKASCKAHVAGDARLSRAGHSDVRLRQQHPQVAHDEGLADAFAFPGFVPAYIRPALLRRQGAVPLGGAVRRPRGYLQDGPQGQGTLPR